MRSAIDRVDIVGKAEDAFGIRVVVLQANFHHDAVFLGFHVDRLVVQDLLAAVQMLDELGDATVVLELGVLGLSGLGVGGALVGERNEQAFVQEGEFAQTLGQRVVVVFRCGEDAPVGQEVNLGARLDLGSACLFQLAGWFARRVRLLPGKSIAPDFQLKFFAKRIHTRDTYPVQAARNFVGGGVKFPARVQLGHYDLRGGNLLAVDVHVVDGNAAAVIDDGNGVVDVNGDFD